MTISPGKLWSLRRLADGGGIFKMTAVDQRPPIERPIAESLGAAEAPWDQVADFKRLLVAELQGRSTAMLLDPNYAIPRAFDILDPRKGLVVTLEDSRFRETPEGRVSSEIDGWSVAKIKRLGADAVKLLVWYRPDSAERVRTAQQDLAKRVGEQCARHDIPFLLEMLVYPLASGSGSGDDYSEMDNKRSDHVLASVEDFAKPDYGVDVFKLESPVNPGAADGGAEVQGLFDEMGALAGRPWVMLSAGAGKPEFRRILEHAFAAGASGFLAGRAIWLDAFGAYPDWERMQSEMAGGAADYLGEIAALAEQQARPWHTHPCYGEGGARLAPADAGFRHSYGE